MTVYYLDPENGNDANNGLSFAARKKTLLSATAAVNAGDEVRVIASPDPTSIGTCTWSDNSDTVTLPAGTVKLVEAMATGFTASANVTANTTSVRKRGSTAAQLAIAGAFTTGKVAYKALGSTLDLSAFQVISFWLQFASGAVGPGVLELRLCSDATGDTPVATIPLQEPDATLTPSGSTWLVVLKDFGSALPSNVNSISIYANSDPGTCTLYLNDLVASKAVGAADHISLVSLIGKNTIGEPEWYPLQWLDDSGAYIGAAAPTNTTNVPRPYRGSTESVTTYARRPLPFVGTTANRTTTGSRAGTYANPIKLTGGWDRTAMSSQSGVSWLSGYHFAGVGITAGTLAYGYRVEKIGLAHYSVTGIRPASWQCYLEGLIACVEPITTPSTNNSAIPNLADVKQVWGHGTALDLPSSAASSPGALLKADRVHGCYGTGAAVTLKGSPESNIRYRFGKADNNAGYGITGATGTSSRVENVTLENNALGDFGLNAGAVIKAARCTMGSANPVVFVTPNDRSPCLFASQVGGAANDHRQYRSHFLVASDASVRHTAAGIAWKVSPLVDGAVNSDFPAETLLGQVAVKSGVLTTVSVWMRRDNTGITAGLRTSAGFVAGVAEVSATMSASANTWQQVSISFTPSADGVVPIYGFAYGGTTFNAWFDDMEAAA